MSRNYVIGLNVGHDSGVALVSDNGIVASINEERLSRNKLHFGFPYLALNKILNCFDISFDNVKTFAISDASFVPSESIEKDWRKNIIEVLGLSKPLLGTENGLIISRLLSLYSTQKYQKNIKGLLAQNGYHGNISYVDHHYAHACSAYYSQSIDNGIVITLDASGDGYCSKVYLANNNNLTEVNRIPCYHSPAYYYLYVTKILGFTPLRHEGKITGLAAYGDPNKCIHIFRELITFDSNKLRFVNYGGYYNNYILQLKELLSGFSSADIAAAIQAHTENLVCQYVSTILDRYGNKSSPTPLFLAGGLFANVKLNQRIASLPNVDSVFIFPNMGDGGLNIGAALSIKKTKFPIKDVFLGEKPTQYSIDEAVKQSSNSYTVPNSIAVDIAKHLANDKVVARYFDKMEYGPRALGHRSILYSAKDATVNEWLNKCLNRTEFMPFAPVVMDIEFDKFFITDTPIKPFEYMTITCDVTTLCKKIAPAVVHVDGTARPQIVYPNCDMYEILSEYKKLTGHGILVNTSFNMHEEPIVNSPKEAVQAFKISNIDVLAIDKYLLFQANRKDEI
jgi:carbamoyltransferase